jgi:hypothetical protein
LYSITTLSFLFAYFRPDLIHPTHRSIDIIATLQMLY